MHGTEIPALRDWYLPEWLDALDVERAAFRRVAGWSEAKTSLIFAGKQGWGRKELFEAASALNLEAWQLLLPPHQAQKIVATMSAISALSQ